MVDPQCKGCAFVPTPVHTSPTASMPLCMISVQASEIAISNSAKIATNTLSKEYRVFSQRRGSTDVTFTGSPVVLLVTVTVALK